MFPLVKKLPKSDSNEIRPEDAELGAKFMAARKAAGLTQGDVAEIAGWGDKDSDAGQKRVSSYETGRRGIGLTDAIAYADALGMNLDDIIGLRKQSVKARKQSR